MTGEISSTFEIQYALPASKSLKVGRSKRDREEGEMILEMCAHTYCIKTGLSTNLPFFPEGGDFFSTFTYLAGRGQEKRKKDTWAKKKVF